MIPSLSQIRSALIDKYQAMRHQLLEHCAATGTLPSDWEIDISKTKMVQNQDCGWTITVAWKPYNPLDHMGVSDDS